MEEGDIASFVVKELGLTLAPETCPDQSQAFKEVKNSQAFTVGRKNIYIPIFFLDEPLPGAPGHVGTKLRANIRRTDCVRPASSPI